MVLRLLAASLVIGMWGTGALAQNCGGAYVIQRGDSLSRIAVQAYRNAFLWTQIYQVNQDTIGPDPDTILVGQRLELPCLDGQPQVSADVEVADPDLEQQPDPLNIELLALSDFPPFSDRRLPGGGMIAELVATASQQVFPASAQDSLERRFVGALSPTFASGEAVPLSFPWLSTACPASQSARCQQVLLSDPMFEVLVVLFTRTDQPVVLRTDDDVAGKIVCSASDNSAEALNAEGRNWINEGIVELRTEPAVAQCFRALMAGAADAVVVNEFTGRFVVQELGIDDHVQALTKSPLSISMLHAAVPRAAPQAKETMTMLNEGLRRVRASGAFQAILDRHLERVWQAS